MNLRHFVLAALAVSACSQQEQPAVPQPVAKSPVVILTCVRFAGRDVEQLSSLKYRFDPNAKTLQTWSDQAGEWAALPADAVLTIQDARLGYERRVHDELHIKVDIDRMTGQFRQVVAGGPLPAIVVTGSCNAAEEPGSVPFDPVMRKF